MAYIYEDLPPHSDDGPTGRIVHLHKAKLRCDAICEAFSFNLSLLSAGRAAYQHLLFIL